MSLVINFLAGPGTGKSTAAAALFVQCKNAGINVELACEYAKDLVWEDRAKTLQNQVYILGKQYHRIFRLQNKVDVIITDSPILLSTIYDESQCPELRALCLKLHNSMDTFNIFLEREKKYNPNGRLQNETEAKEIDFKIYDFLLKYNITHYVLKSSEVPLFTSQILAQKNLI